LVTFSKETETADNNFVLGLIPDVLQILNIMIKMNIARIHDY
jgi:hypothetical protein